MNGVQNIDSDIIELCEEAKDLTLEQDRKTWKSGEPFRLMKLHFRMVVKTNYLFNSGSVHYTKNICAYAQRAFDSLVEDDQEDGFWVRVSRERGNQMEKWGDVHDMRHDAERWARLICRDLVRAEESLDTSETPEAAYVRNIVKVAALCVASLRQHSLHSRGFV